MDKNKIIEDIQKKLDCSKETAKRFFEEGLENGMIVKRVNWENLISLVIKLAILFTGIWALYRVLTK